MEKKTINGLIDYACELSKQKNINTVFVLVSDEGGQGSYVSGKVIEVAADLSICMHKVKDLKKVCEMAIDAYTNVPYKQAD